MLVGRTSFLDFLAMREYALLYYGIHVVCTYVCEPSTVCVSMFYIFTLVGERGDVTTTPVHTSPPLPPPPRYMSSYSARAYKTYGVFSVRNRYSGVLGRRM